MGFLQFTLTPNDWLAESLKRRQLPQRVVARAVGVDTSLFGRWVRGDEQIPRKHLVELGQHLPPSDIDYLLRLKDCEDLADHLARRAERLSQSPSFQVNPLAALTQRLTDLLEQEALSDQRSRVDSVIRHLIDASGAVALMQRLVDVDFHESVLIPESVPRFRYPLNHFVGTLFELPNRIARSSREVSAAEDFRERLLTNLRGVLRGKHPTARWQELARQFSVHLLARHGSALDRQNVKDLVQPRGSTIDPLLQRISFTGVILGGTDREAMDRFLFTLKRGRSLADVNLFFNAFHYGDAVFDADGSLPSQNTDFSRAVPHVLRHLEHPEQYAGILNIELWTLLQMLEKAGPHAFRQPAIRTRIARLLQADGNWHRQAESSVKKQFLRKFTRLLRDEKHRA